MIADTKVGMRLIADGGFTCLLASEIVEVKRDEGGLYVPCKDGRHYLAGQVDGDHYIGLSTFPVDA